MIVCIALLGIGILLWAMFRKEHIEVFQNLPQKGNELKQIYPVAFGILKLLSHFDFHISSKIRKQSIERLNITKEQKDNETLFNIRRISLVYVVVMASAMMGMLYEFANTGNGKLLGNQMMRPSYGGIAENNRILANGEEIEFSISPREFSPQEVQENFTKAHELLVKEILGNNESLGSVRENLNLVTYLEPYAITVNWLSSDSETISIYGEVNNYEFQEQEAREVTLTAILTYLDYTCNDDLFVTVLEPDLDEKENFVRKLLNQIKKQDGETKQLQMLELPQSVDGNKVSYSEKKESNAWLLLLLGIATAIAIFPGMDKDLAGKMKERSTEMKMDYSEIVSKLTILMGAGMSVLRAWEKIVKDYENALETQSKKKRFAYEEMRITYYEIQSGISESQSYAAFGKRCNVHEYLKLGALLEQNVKKGAKGLSKMLEEEANLAFEERKNLARKLGEEAGTKMLIPMILMLAIVMIIVLIPAFSSFSL